MSKRPSEQPTADRLVQEFMEAAIRDYDAKAADDFKTSKIAVGQKRAAVKALDAIPPAGRTALVPLLDHPDLGVVVSAATYLCLLMPERVLPILRKISGMNTKEELDKPHALRASWHASSTIMMYEDGHLEGNLKF